jgi:hypothetical protein
MRNKVDVNEKIKVFISSQCGNEKYDRVRRELKKLIERTGFAKVYLFEETLASTQTSAQDYLYALDDSDVCIFLIDNADGVTPAVLREIKRAKSHPKKSLYLFCKERKEEPTQIQKELTGAQGIKYYVTNTFEEFVCKGYESLINDISKVYSNYCKNRLIDPEFTHTNKTDIEVHSGASESIEKKLLKGIDKTRLYFGRQILRKFQKEINETSDLDVYCEDFLRVLFGEKSIREFNTSLLLSLLEELQSEKLHKVIKYRWKAIQHYWNDNIDRCIENEEIALKIAKENELPNWIIQDILIDLRNLYTTQGHANNIIIYNSEAQKELDKETAVLFYPIIDRNDKSLYEEITNQIIKSSTRSPYTVSFGNNIERYVEYLSNIYFVAVFNGSLTHILMILDRLKDIAFNLCKEYSDWQFRVLLLKLSISQGNEKEIDGFIDLFNDIFGKMNASDALEIYNFSSSVPIKHNKDIARLEAYKHLGYFFSDKDYECISKEILSLIKDWVSTDNCNVILGDHVFKALEKNYLRIDRNNIIKICLDIFDKKRYRFYDNALDLLAKMGLKNIDDDLVKRIIEEINRIILDKTNRDNFHSLEQAIIAVRKTKKEYTEELHKNVIKFMPELYEGRYKLETMIESQEDSEEQIYKYVFEIKRRNQTQGMNGSYTLYVDNPFSIIKNIIVINRIKINEKLLNAILEVTKETLFCPKQLVSDKVEAIKLIIFIKLNTDLGLYDYADFINQIENNKDVIIDGFCDMLYKHTKTTAQFGYMMLRMIFNRLNYQELLELLSTYIELEEFERIEALKMLISVFENNYCNIVDENILLMLLQFVLGQSHNTNHDVRFKAMKAILHMITSTTKDTILTRLSKAMDYDSVYIKNLIINHAESLMKIDPEVLNFIMQKASIDNHYVIRKRGCEFISNKN